MRAVLSDINDCRKRKDALYRIDKDGVITEEDRELLPGIHFCLDWDGLAIFEKCIEYPLCNCPHKEKPLEP
jgi:hypothetical protein